MCYIHETCNRVSRPWMLTTGRLCCLQEVHGLTLAATPQQNINVLT